MVVTFQGSGEQRKRLHDAKATFLLAGSLTRTYEVEGITQAGIPGKIHLTPTLDAEFVDSGRLFSLDNIAETPKGVPTPAIITRAVRRLTDFAFEVLDLGLDVEPKVEVLHRSGLMPSGNILEGAGIDAKSVIERGRLFGEKYEHLNDILLLGESTPAGTTTAYATAKALGVDADGCFSSSFKNAPANLKKSVVDEALLRVEDADLYARLGAVSDNMLLFCAGFASAFSQKAPVVLGGGTQMAAVLLLIDKLGLEVNRDNISLMTTGWVYRDANSDIAGLLKQLSQPVEASYADFSFAKAQIPVLKLYDEGEAKEGVGAGAALCLALENGFGEEEIVREVEKVLTA